MPTITHTEAPNAAQGGPLILVVEDERSIAEPLARALAGKGFRAVLAVSGTEAVELASSLDPDAVLLDLALPDMDGRDVCRALRRERSSTRQVGHGY